VSESRGDLETELKRRYDLIPRLVEVVRGHAAHEKEVLDRVTRARAMAMTASDERGREAGESELASAVRGLLAVVENYPELKSDGSFARLQAELVRTEDRVQAARRLHNANVRENNTACEGFPGNLVARLFGFRRATFFELDSAVERSVPDVSVGAGG
jgi:LemA protein